MVERRDAKPARRRFVFRPRRRLRLYARETTTHARAVVFNVVSKPWCRSITLARAVARRALFYFCAAKSGMCSLAIVLGFLSPSPMLRNQLRKKCAPKMRPKNPFM